MTTYTAKVRHGASPQEIPADGQYHNLTAKPPVKLARLIDRFPVEHGGKIRLEYQVVTDVPPGSLGHVIAWRRDDDRPGLDPTGANTTYWGPDAKVSEWHSSPGAHVIDASPDLTHVCLGLRVLGDVPLRVTTRVVKVAAQKGDKA